MSDKSLEGNLEFLRDVKYPLDLKQQQKQVKKKSINLCVCHQKSNLWKFTIFWIFK